MTSDEELTILRRAYAKQIMAVFDARDARDERVEAAFAKVPREGYLGPGPWPILRFGRGYVETPSADPVYLYSNCLIGIRPEDGLNNGEPSLHAFLLSKAAIREGAHVVHVGAGVGYYSAVMAELAGPSGRVTAIEYEPALAARAEANLAAAGTVTVLEGDGTTLPFDPADVIYVNAGVTRPAESWLDRLRDGGRMILPLTTEKGFGQKSFDDMARRGAIFLVTRDGDDFHARWISPVAIFPCKSLREPESEAALAAAFENEDWKRVTRLYRDDALPEERCWLRGNGWALAYD
ncbi:MAG: methyltransferase domain-containing protein [Kiloniellales bacterium]|nr:methyltransferase domain-containing protein [Kiloniellales bacterium]